MRVKELVTNMHFTATQVDVDITEPPSEGIYIKVSPVLPVTIMLRSEGKGTTTIGLEHQPLRWKAWCLCAVCPTWTVSTKILALLLSHNQSTFTMYPAQLV